MVVREQDQGPVIGGLRAFGAITRICGADELGSSDWGLELECS